MNKKASARAAGFFPSDIGDELEVFVYENLSTIISPHPEVLLTRDFRASLVSALNGVGSRPTTAQKDLLDVVNVFIITNAGKLE